MKRIKKHIHGIITAVLCCYLFAGPAYTFAALGAANALMSLGLAPELAKYITSSLVNVDASGNLVLPVASGKTLSVTVAGTEKASLSASGALTTSSAHVITSGNITATNGEFISSTSGKSLSLQEATAGDACMGTATTNGTTAVTVSTTCATTGSRIFLSRTADATGTAANDQSGCWTTNIVNGTSFDIDCSDTGDNGAVNWIIFHESA